MFVFVSRILKQTGQSRAVQGKTRPRQAVADGEEVVSVDGEDGEIAPDDGMVFPVCRHLAG